MGCPVSNLSNIMPAEELLQWAYRYEFGKFGKKLNDHRAAIQCKIIAEAFSESSRPLSDYMVKFERDNRSPEQKKIKNLAIANAIFGGIIPKEIIQNGYSSITDSTTEA